MQTRIPHQIFIASFLASSCLACSDGVMTGDSGMGMDIGTGDSGPGDTGMGDSGPGDTGMGDSGGADSGGADSGADGGGMTFCMGSLDDGDTQATGTMKPTLTDCDEMGYAIDADLDGDDDVDWFVIAATDEPFCDSAPSVTTGADVRVCMYAECDNMMAATITCRDGLPDTSDAGNPGCCTTGGGSTLFDIDCGGILESTDAEITIRVDQGTAMICRPYTLDFNY